MNRITLKNKVRILINPHVSEQLYITSWGAEYDNYTGERHLLEHIIINNPVKVEGYTRDNMMVFSANDDNTIENIIELFFDKDNIPLLTKKAYQNYIKKKYNKEIMSIHNENLFRIAEGDNIIDKFLFNRLNTCGNKTTLTEPVNKFIKFVYNCWNTLEPQDILIVVKRMNSTKLSIIQQTFGAIKAITDKPAPKPNFTFNYKFGLYKILMPSYNKITFIVEDYNPQDFYSYLHFNQNVKLERIVNNKLILNLNSYEPFTTQHILDGIQIESKNIFNKEIITYTAMCKSNFITDIKHANNFLKILTNLTKTFHYITCEPLVDVQAIQTKAVNILLTIKTSKLLKIKNYQYVLFLVPLILDINIMDNLGEYVRFEKLAYSFDMLYVNEEEEYSIIGTNCLNNKVLHLQLKKYFQKDIIALFIEKN